MFRFNIKTVSSCLTAAIHVHTKYYEIWRVKHIFEYRANEKNVGDVVFISIIYDVPHS